MNARKLVAGMAAAAGGLLLLTMVLSRDEIHDWLYAIRRVRTWGDLLAQKPIELSDGVVIRLGIEDTRCPQGSGVLLYCLTEGYDPSSRMFDDTVLGPLDVSIVEEDSAAKDDESASAVEVFESLRKEQAPTERCLFARSIQIPRPGRYHVIVSEGGTELRRVTLDGIHESRHPWLMVEPSQKLGTPSVGEGAFLGEIVPGGGWPVVPFWGGVLPYTEGNANSSPDPLRPLPRLFPEAEAPPEIDLQIKGDSLMVTSRRKLRFCKENIAARWWVNGVPHVPRKSRRLEGNFGGLESHVDQFELELNFAASPLEVRSGDRVSIQLMYSAQGWSLMDGGGWFSFFPDEQRVLVSNRIELTVP